MKKKIQSAIIFVLLTKIAIAQVSHSGWNTLLQKHVDEKGFVDYQGFKSDISLVDTYLKQLEANAPQKEWTEEEKLSYWINLYNAATIKLIADNLPLKSIRDIEERKGTSPWKITFVKSGGKTLSLDAIEHEIIRKEFETPLIHFGVNCASFSCPILHNKAFTAKNIRAELEKLASRFINDPQRNKIVSSNKAELSQIFNWFKGDFTKNGSLTDFINKYSDTKLKSNAQITFSEYNWSLNAKK